MSEERNELCPWVLHFSYPRHRSGRLTALNRRLKASPLQAISLGYPRHRRGPVGGYELARRTRLPWGGGIHAFTSVRP